MLVEQFNIQPTIPNVFSVIVSIAVVLIVFGAVLIVTNLLLRNRFKDRSLRGTRIMGVGIGLDSRYSLTLIGISLIVTMSIVSGVLYKVPSVATVPSVVTIGAGYINVESKDFMNSAPIFHSSNNKNVTSDEIVDAFVGQVGTGDFKLHKECGINFGDTNAGIYTLGNYAKAYVATTNSTCLIIKLKSSEYIIIGNQDTQAIANSFSRNVHRLTT